MLTVILTGGKSRRMGRDKAMLPIDSDGTSMRDELIRRYAGLGSVAISVDQAGRYTGDKAIELPDAFPGQGPINGLYSAFQSTDTDSVFLTATDLINGDPELAQFLAQSLGSHEACVIRRNCGFLEPLFAIYTRGCAEIAEKCLREGRHSMLQVINNVDTVFVDERDLCDRWNLDEVLLNINTPEEYEKFKAK